MRGDKWLLQGVGSQVNVEKAIPSPVCVTDKTQGEIEDLAVRKVHLKVVFA